MARGIFYASIFFAWGLVFARHAISWALWTQLAGVSLAFLICSGAWSFARCTPPS